MSFMNCSFLFSCLQWELLKTEEQVLIPVQQTSCNKLIKSWYMGAAEKIEVGLFLILIKVMCFNERLYSFGGIFPIRFCLISKSLVYITFISISLLSNMSLYTTVWRDKSVVWSFSLTFFQSHFRRSC